MQNTGPYLGSGGAVKFDIEHLEKPLNKEFRQ